MKHKLLMVLGMCLSVMGWGQTVDGKNIAADSTVGYLEISSSYFYTKNKAVVLVNYGQEIKSSRTDTSIEGPDGKPVIFYSAMDAVNHFHYWGWELMSVYESTISADASRSYYVMRRKGK